MEPRLSLFIRPLSRTPNWISSRSIPSSSFRPHISTSTTRPQRPTIPIRVQHLEDQKRCIHNSSIDQSPSRPPKSRDRGPKSKEETQTDFGILDVLRNTAAPATAIDACTSDGFALNNQQRVTGSGILLIGGEAFRWWPWEDVPSKRKKADGQVGSWQDELTGRLTNARGQWEVKKEAWGVLDLVWPKPDLLIIGTGPHMLPLSPTTRRHINDLGIRLEVQDTRNAAAQFNLLATERGVQQVAAAMIPIGWMEAR